MKNILDKIRGIIKPDEEEEVTPKKAIVFFGFYLVFFGVLIAMLVFGGNKNYLTQEYEKGNISKEAYKNIRTAYPINDDYDTFMLLKKLNL